MKKAIVITGNPVDGFEFYGPLDSLPDAVEFGSNSTHLFGKEWWAAELQSTTEEGNPT